MKSEKDEKINLTSEDLKDYDVSNIDVLEGLEPVRKRPGMYIGSTGPKGLHHLVYEIFDNSVDEHEAGFCSHIVVELNKDSSITVKDNGRGIPVDIHPKTNKSAVETVLTVLHAGGKFGNGGYKVSGGLHGVGVSVVNALSEKLVVEVSRNDNLYRQEYSKGKPLTELEVVGKSTHTGTTITFLPDKTIFESVVFNSETIKDYLFEKACLNKGLSIEYRDNITEEVFYYKEEDGLKSLLAKENEDKPVITDIITLSGKTYMTDDNGNLVLGKNKKPLENISVEVAFQYIDEFTPEHILSYCNNICTEEGGTHVTGLKTALTKVINSYIESYKLNKGKKLEGKDISNGFTCVLSIKHLEPQFEGQTKTKLGNSDARGAVLDVFTEESMKFFDRNSEILNLIIEQALKAKNKRKKQTKSLSDVRREVLSLVAKKITPCACKDPEKAEVIFVEGDSAGGTAKQARDRLTQAILALKGKVLNVEKSKLEKILSNDEIKSIFACLGCGYGDDFDASKLLYHKIIILTDADVDGEHIRTLLLTLFYRYAPQLIDGGYVYIGIAPLYKVSYKQGRSRKETSKYLYSDAELVEFKKKINSKNITIQRYKGLGEMSAEQLWDTTLNPETRKMVRVKIRDKEEADKVVNLLMGDNSTKRRSFIEKKLSSNKEGIA